MKQKSLLKTMLLLFALIAGSSSVWAAEAGFTLASATQVPLAAGDTKTTTITGTASETWNVEITGTWSSSSLQGSAGDKIWQLGKKDGAISTATFSTSGITGTITKVVVRCSSYAGKAQVRCTVGGSDFGTQAQSTPSWTTIGNVTFSGSASGAIVVTLDNSDAAARAVYIQSITVTYTPDATVDVTGVTVDPTEWEMEVGDTKELTATVAPAEATNKAVTWKSDDESVATVSNAGVVTAIAAGTATITVTTTDGGKTTTCAITVNEPAPDPAAGPVALTFDFTDAGWGFPESYDKTEKSYTNNGYTFTLGASSNGHKAYITNGSTVSLIFGKKDATLTFPAFDFNVSKIKVYGYSSASGKTTFNIYVDDDAVSTEVTGSKTSQTFEIAADKQTAGTIYTLKITNDNNCQISKIEIFGYVNATIAASGYSTIAKACGLDFSQATPAGLEAYVASAVTASGVTLSPITAAPKNTGVILKGAAGTEYTIPVKEGAAAVGTNYLKAAVAAYNCAANEVYILKGGKFCKVTAASTVPAGKAYLLAEDVPVAAPELEFNFGGTTGIDEVRGKKEDVRGEYYNLAGQRVANPTKGLYIVNGKKVVIK